MDIRQGWSHIDQLRAQTADLLSGLDASEWDAASWCRGWTVHDVAAHLGVPAMTPTSGLVRSALACRFDLDATMNRLTKQRSAHRTPTQVVDDLNGLVGNRRLVPGTTWRDVLVDALVHAQDIVRPLGRLVVVPPALSAEAASWVWQRSFPFRAAKRLADVRLVADDVEWQRGRGPVVTGPVHSLLLLTTGREQVTVDLEGPGLHLLPTAADRAAAGRTKGMSFPWRSP